SPSLLLVNSVVPSGDDPALSPAAAITYAAIRGLSVTIAFLTLASTSTVGTVEVRLIDKNPALTLARLARLRANQSVARAGCARFGGPIRHTAILEGRRRFGRRGPGLLWEHYGGASLSPGDSWRNRPKPVLLETNPASRRVNGQIV